MGKEAEISPMVGVVKGLKKLRKEKGLTQRDVLYDTGILVSRIEAQQTSISIDTLHKICSHYDVSIESFFINYYNK